MRVKMCVTNLDLFSNGDDYGLIDKITNCNHVEQKIDYELEENHCLGLCFLCQKGPTAIIRGNIFHIGR